MKHEKLEDYIQKTKEHSVEMVTCHKNGEEHYKIVSKYPFLNTIIKKSLETINKYFQNEDSED